MSGCWVGEPTNTLDWMGAEIKLIKQRTQQKGRGGQL